MITEIEMKMAWDALQNIKMFFALNERNRYGLEIAQKVLAEQIKAAGGGNPPPAE